ncbi:hypothetical protein T02_13321 [Trichinella nativa]|uniref:Uncharacterized protein n=1 Tax=Trichinella nativa TaxID=6335 RepID=A0A0V1LLR7_9BILA|nr:hypothetical protein T02_13321 [Trichinella nativa]
MSATGLKPLPFIYLFHLSNFLSNSLVTVVYFLSTCIPLDCERLFIFSRFRCFHFVNAVHLFFTVAVSAVG